MKASLALKMSQNLAMTPQLQQAIRLLQLSSLDLQQEINAVLEENPMLELQDDDNFEQDPLAESFSKSKAQENLEQISSNEEYLNQEYQEHESIPQELAVDAGWEDVYQTSASNLPSNNDEDRNFSEIDTKDESLQDHLLWQLNIADVTEKQRLIAKGIISCINNQGYVEEKLEYFVEIFSKYFKVHLHEVLEALKIVQTFDPIGVGARNLKECLLLQLKQLPENTPDLTLVIFLVKNYLDILGSRDYKKITKLMNISEEKLKNLITLIKNLNPRPGLVFSDTKEEYIVPDLIVKKVSGNWTVELNQAALPKLKINNYYSSLISSDNNKDDNSFMRTKLQDAKWFIKSMQMRNETLLKVASQIVTQQRAFFEYGAQAMKPMVLQDIANSIEMHESTVSRVTTQKYMHTPQGVFELKYFFSTSMTTTGGGECSATAIRALIKQLISEESPHKPLSDSKLVKILEDKGIVVARRTVAKYRESLGIAATSVRKHLL